MPDRVKTRAAPIPPNTACATEWGAQACTVVVPGGPALPGVLLSLTAFLPAPGGPVEVSTTIFVDYRQAEELGRALVEEAGTARDASTGGQG
jgi:hypothetical protein